MLGVWGLQEKDEHLVLFTYAILLTSGVFLAFCQKILQEAAALFFGVLFFYLLHRFNTTHDVKRLVFIATTFSLMLLTKATFTVFVGVGIIFILYFMWRSSIRPQLIWIPILLLIFSPYVAWMARDVMNYGQLYYPKGVDVSFENGKIGISYLDYGKAHPIVTRLKWDPLLDLLPGYVWTLVFLYLLTSWRSFGRTYVYLFISMYYIIFTSISHIIIERFFVHFIGILVLYAAFVIWEVFHKSELNKTPYGYELQYTGLILLLVSILLSGEQIFSQYVIAITLLLIFYSGFIQLPSYLKNRVLFIIPAIAMVVLISFVSAPGNFPRDVDVPGSLDYLEGKIGSFTSYQTPDEYGVYEWEAMNLIERERIIPQGKVRILLVVPTKMTTWYREYTFLFPVGPLAKMQFGEKQEEYEKILFSGDSSEYYQFLIEQNISYIYDPGPPGDRQSPQRDVFVKVIESLEDLDLIYEKNGYRLWRVNQYL